MRTPEPLPLLPLLLLTWSPLLLPLPSDDVPLAEESSRSLRLRFAAGRFPSNGARNQIHVRIA